VAVSPDGRSVYVTNFSGDSISQYDVDAGAR
jgi:DNA-binding beta-propeller fold protein YncE